MSTANIVAEVVQHIIKQGKDVLHDQYINKEKVPSFTTKQSSSNYEQIVIHGGYQSENRKKYAQVGFNKDNTPQSIPKDNLAIKSHSVTRQYKSFIKASPALKSTYQKFYSSKKKNRNNHNLTDLSVALDNSPKQKQNRLVKLDENNNNRIVIDRVKKRIESEQQKMREKKRLKMLSQYEQKLENQVFKKQRQDRQASKERLLQNHTKKGQTFKFNFDNDGQLLLFESSNHLKRNYPPQTAFKIQSSIQEIEECLPQQTKFERQKSLNIKAKDTPDNVHPLQRNYNENQRIRSARGQAFASAVMKTVNLSRISMNGSLIEVDAEQFMKRNDLFNNNHSRQTSSIPYLQPKVGTVYTEIATNQVVCSGKDPHSSTTALAKQDMSCSSRDTSRKGKGFDGFYQQHDRKYSKTARVIGNHDEENQDIIKTSTRQIKTAKQSGRCESNSEKRPQTSVYRGKITTTNLRLVQSLLQQ